MVGKSGCREDVAFGDGRLTDRRGKVFVDWPIQRRWEC